MDLSTFTNLFLGGIGIIAALMGWLWRHSVRLTRVEVQQDNNSRRINENAARTATDFQDIKGALIRIEDMVSRQHSSPRRNGE